MIKRETFVQKEPNSMWDVTVPEEGYKARPLAAYTPNGNSKEIDSWFFENGLLHVSFGIDVAAGELEYEYQVDGKDTVTTLEHDGNQVSIVIHQHSHNPKDSQQ